jgi:hypothetical protein
MAYIVRLTKDPKPFHWRRNYFPRKEAYRRDAIALKKAVESLGGQVTMERFYGIWSEK